MIPKFQRSSADEAPQPETTEAPASQQADFLALLARPRAAPQWPLEPMFVATCVDARHPTLNGRVRARWESTGGDPDAQEWWVPSLHGLAIRVGDRLLLSRVGGLPDPIVVGVIDGFTPRPVPSAIVGATLELQPDEALSITDRSGQPLLQITQEAGGPVVHLLQADTQIDLQGRLTITAAELTLKAVRGDVHIEASDQVTVCGETVHLN